MKLRTLSRSLTIYLSLLMLSNAFENSLKVKRGYFLSKNNNDDLWRHIGVTGPSFDADFKISTFKIHKHSVKVWS